ncbi:hypothetical protein PP707_01990 [Acetobacter pasteurianus]|nr:hypothetical protein [Acetobacter pasteurianus]
MVVFVVEKNKNKFLSLLPFHYATDQSDKSKEQDTTPTNQPANQYLSTEEGGKINYIIVTLERN